MKLKVLDLFSGIGGFSIGLERAGMETIGFCENDDRAALVLNKNWPEVKVFGDIRNLTAKKLSNNMPDVICGGFPCQGISVAGKQKGLEDSRSGPWSEYARIIGEVRPKYAIMENVAALLSGDNGAWFGEILGDLAAIGYDAIWNCIPASAAGAPHERDRAWIIAFPNGQQSMSVAGSRRNDADDSKSSNTKCERLQRYIKRWLSLSGFNRSSYTKFGDQELYVGAGFTGLSEYLRVGDGFSDQPYRIKQLGNAVVPILPEILGMAIIEYENNKDL